MATVTRETMTLRAKRRSLGATTFGNVMEWYEWGAYAVFAPYIAAVMFNPDDLVSGLLSTFAVFAGGFLTRPIGGIVFGRIADKRGRKVVLISTLLLMAAASLFIGLMPTYATIGAWASLLLLIARLVQGLAHGGESATSNSYVAEIAPRERRALWGSSIFVAVLGGTFSATAVAIGLTLTLGDETIREWAWRVPFLIGGLLALVVLVLRGRMKESDVFEEHKAKEPVELTPADRTSVRRSIGLVIALVAGLTVTQYSWLSFVSSYAIVQVGIPSAQVYVGLAIAQLVALATVPFWGKLSDRIGRRPMFITFAIFMVIVQFPLMALVSSSTTFLVATTVALVIAASTGALQAATFSELFPTRVRTLGIGFAFSISVAVFGGTAPYLNQLFYSIDQGWISNLYVILACISTGVAAYLMPETKGIDLNAVESVRETEAAGR